MCNFPRKSSPQDASCVLCGQTGACVCALPSQPPSREQWIRGFACTSTRHWHAAAPREPYSSWWISPTAVDPLPFSPWGGTCHSHPSERQAGSKPCTLISVSIYKKWFCIFSALQMPHRPWSESCIAFQSDRISFTFHKTHCYCYPWTCLGFWGFHPLLTLFLKNIHFIIIKSKFS